MNDDEMGVMILHIGPLLENKTDQEDEELFPNDAFELGFSPRPYSFAECCSHKWFEVRQLLLVSGDDEIEKDLIHQRREILGGIVRFRRWSNPTVA